MNAKTLGGLTAFTAAFAAAFVITSGGDDDSVEAGSGLLFPTLEERVNDVARLVLRQGEDQLELRREGGTWTLGGRGGYPAEFEPAKETVLQVANLTIDEVKTANPAYHEQLGLDPDAENSRTRSVALYDESGSVLAEVLLGNTPRGTREGSFARRAGEDQTYQVDGRVTASTRLADWAETELLALAADRIASVTIEHPDGARLDLARDPLDPASPPQVLGVPADRELSYETVASSITGALASLSLEDVAGAADGPLPAEGTTTARFTCTDGLVVTLELADVDGTWWSRIGASVDESLVPAPTPPPVQDEGADDTEVEAAETAEGEDAPLEPTGPSAQERYEAELAARETRLQATREEAERLAAQHGPWQYALPSFRATNLTKRLEDLLKPLPEPAPNPVEGVDPEPDLTKLLQEAGIDPEALLQEAEAITGAPAEPPVEDPAGGQEPQGDPGNDG